MATECPVKAEETAAVFVAHADLALSQKLGLEIATSSRLRLVGSEISGMRALSAVVALQPDVVLLGLEFADINALSLLQLFDDIGYEGKTLIVGTEVSSNSLVDALRVGAQGYVCIDDEHFFQLESAILAVHEGGVSVPSSALNQIVEALRTQAASARKLVSQRMSRREQEVLLLLSHGYRPKEISQALNISYETVRTHQKNIYKKLEVNSVSQAIAALYQAN